MMTIQRAFRSFVFFFIVYFSFISASFAIDKNNLQTPAESLMPMLFGLVIILALIFLLAFLFRKFSNFGLSGKNIQIIETQMIGNKEKLMIIQVQKQQFLIGVTGQTISQLGELEQLVDSGTQFAATEKKSHSFSNIFNQLLKPVEKNKLEQNKASRKITTENAA